MPIVLKSGSLNLLEPSGPVKACNGIDLPFNYIAMEVAIYIKEHKIKEDGHVRLNYLIG
jgi:hypothetical protein